MLQKKLRDQSKPKYPDNYFSDTEAVVNKRKKRTRSLERKRKSGVHSDHNDSSSTDGENGECLENVKLEIVEINNNDKQTSFPPSSTKDQSLQPQQRTSLVITEPDEITKGDQHRRLSVCSSVSSSAASAISSSISRPSIIILNHHHHHHHSENGATAAAAATSPGSNAAIINASSSSLASNWNHNHNNLRRSVSCNSPASSIVTIDEILNGYNAQIIDDYGTVELRKSPVSIM